MAIKCPYLLMMAFDSLGEHYQALNELSADSRFTLLRAGQSHNGQALQLWSCTEPDIRISVKPQDLCWIEKPADSLIEGYFRQSKVTVQTSLLILESESLGALLQASNEVISKSGFHLIDVDRSSGLRKKAVAYLANGDSSTVKPQIPAGVKATVIEKPSATTLQFFNI